MMLDLIIAVVPVAQNVIGGIPFIMTMTMTERKSGTSKIESSG